VSLREAVANEVSLYYQKHCELVVRIFADFKKLAEQITPQGEDTQRYLDRIRAFALGVNSLQTSEFIDTGSDPKVISAKVTGK